MRYSHEWEKACGKDYMTGRNIQKNTGKWEHMNGASHNRRSENVGTTHMNWENAKWHTGGLRGYK